MPCQTCDLPLVGKNRDRLAEMKETWGTRGSVYEGVLVAFPFVGQVAGEHLDREGEVAVEVVVRQHLPYR